MKPLRQSPAPFHYLCTIACAGLEIDLLGRKVSCVGRIVELTPREFDALALLAECTGEIVSRQTQATDIWRQENRFTSLDNVINVHLADLRRNVPSANRTQAGVTLDAKAVSQWRGPYPKNTVRHPWHGSPVPPASVFRAIG
jgi:DNA-binding response OmpR family regulator